MTQVRIAAAAWPVDQVEDLAEYLDRLTRWTERAARNDAQMLVFPEYGGFVPASMFAADVGDDVMRATEALLPLQAEIDAHIDALAQRCGMFILAPSAPQRSADQRLRNIATFHAPSGQRESQAKMIPTPWDRANWNLVHGKTQSVFDTPFGLIGVAICYDIEFPNLVRNLTNAGAKIILCPSCTDALSGYSRVKIGAQARALESQCVVVQSPTVGLGPWGPVLDVNVGAAGAFGPPDIGFPETGVIALGELDAPGWTYADIDTDLVANARAKGATLNHQHWDEQPAGPVQRIVLR